MAFSKRTSFVIAVVLSLGLVWLLLRQIDNQTILFTIKNLSWPLALTAFLLYVVIYLSRAMRFNALLKKPLPLGKMLTIMCIHNVVNLALPARSGDLSYPYLLKKQGVPVAESLSGLIAARLFDLVAIFGIFLLAVPFVQHLPPFTAKLIYAFAGMLVFLFVMVGILLTQKKLIKRMVDWARRALRVHEVGWMTKLQRLTGKVIDALQQHANRRTLGRLLVHSLAQWALMFYFSYTVLRALGMDVTIAQSFIGSSLSMLVLVIPFQGVLGFGTTEAVWTVMFLALGFPKDQLIAMAFASHILTLFFSAVMGLYGAVRMNRLRGKSL